MVDFSDLDTPLGPVASKKKFGITCEQIIERTSIANGGEANHQQVKCPKCGGRGSLVYGYVNIRTYPCHMCKRTGKVTQKRIERVEAAKKARVTREINLSNKLAQFQAEHKEVFEFIVRNCWWSEFYRSINAALESYGYLTENQLAAVHRGMEKAAQKRAARQQEQDSRSKSVDITAIEQMFAAAAASGLKRLKFRTEHIDISVAPNTGRNAGSLYVFHDGQYAGKITSGKFLAGRDAQENTLTLVEEIAKDPAGQARLYGKRTGNCCLCGKELSNSESIEAGIGPICAGKWRL